jgi:hypothetical protein
VSKFNRSLAQSMGAFRVYSIHLRDEIVTRPISLANYRYGCTARAGSSSASSLVNNS